MAAKKKLTPGTPQGPGLTAPVSETTNNSTTYNQGTGKWDTRVVQDWTPEERAAFGVGKTGTIDQRTANAILQQRRANAKGGATNAEIKQREQDAYDRAVAALANGAGGAGAGGYGKMLDTLKQLGDYSAQGINSSMDQLLKTLGEQKNPYANFQAQNTSTTPELQQLLQSQGVNPDPLQQYASAINAQNTGQANAFQNQAMTNRDIYGANQVGAIQDTAAQRAQLLNSLQANTFGTGAALMGKKAPKRDAIVQMLLAAMKNRA